MNILIIAEHDNKRLKPSLANLVTAARQLSSHIEVLVAGHDCQAVAQQAANIQGVSKVLQADDIIYQHALAENIAALIANLSSQFQVVLAAASTFGKNCLPRAAALKDMSMISEITAIISPDTFVRPIYAGNAFATVQSSDPIKFITVRSSSFAKASLGGAAPCEMITIKIENHPGVEFISLQQNISLRPELSAARIVVSGGRGLQNGENFKLLEQLADKLGAAVGASRAAVDAGFVPNDYQVGQTGKIVAPDLYIAIGISGAIQHLAGMKDSKVIVAINKDPDAPIFQIADYGLVGDLFVLVPELIASL